MIGSLKHVAKLAALAAGALGVALATWPAGGAGTGSISVTDAWARATIPGRPVAVYAAIANSGADDDRLLSAATPAAARVELHTHIKDGEIMRMRPVESIEVPAGRSTLLQPGGLHIMLFEPIGPLEESDRFRMTLTFERAGSLETEVVVRPIGYSAGTHGGGHGHGAGQHGGMSGHDAEAPAD